jgi:hypothetical protein
MAPTIEVVFPLSPSSYPGGHAEGQAREQTHRMPRLLGLQRLYGTESHHAEGWRRDLRRVRQAESAGPHAQDDDARPHRAQVVEQYRIGSFRRLK